MTAKSRLSSAQWLNVIILVVSGMILILILVGRAMQVSTAEKPVSQLKISQLAELKQIDFNGVSIVFKNGQWQSFGAQVSTESMYSIVAAWQNLLTQQGRAVATESYAGEIISLYLTSRARPIMCKLVRNSDYFKIIFVEQEQEFEFPIAQLSNYFPEEK
ncbi:hypothetical protein ACUR5C_01980 [Aliikangiella sp. IMCC44653]